jgi:monomeric sarcosine oxidase
VSQQRFVIVGAGIVGLSTAYALLKQGVKNVTVLEQVAVDHHRATSHGISRLLRFEYGADMLYSKMVQLSLQRWHYLEQVSQRTLYTETGVLVLGEDEDNSTKPAYHILSNLGIPIERLSSREVAQRFPQFASHHYDLFTYNPHAGMLHASNCLQTLRDLVIASGGSILENHSVEHISYDNPCRPIQIHLASGTTMTADRLLLATGPWVHRLLGDLHLPVQPTRQYLLYFANLPTSAFALHSFPAFIADDLYGFPLHNTCAGRGPCWLKAASHRFGTPIDPDARIPVEQQVIEQVSQRLYKLIPALQDAQLVQVDSCMYDVSREEHFILDYHPHDARVVFATGLTGHGFKFGPLLGEILCSLLRDTPPPVPLDRFRLARFAPHWLTQTSSVA